MNIYDSLHLLQKQALLMKEKESYIYLWMSGYAYRIHLEITLVRKMAAVDSPLISLTFTPMGSCLGM